MKLAYAFRWFFALIAFLLISFYLLALEGKKRFENLSSDAGAVSKISENMMGLDKLRLDVLESEDNFHSKLLSGFRDQYSKILINMEAVEASSLALNALANDIFQPVYKAVGLYLNKIEVFEDARHKLNLLSKQASTLWHQNDEALNAHYELFQNNQYLIEMLLSNYNLESAKVLEKRLKRHQNSVVNLPFDMKMQVLDSYYERSLAVISIKGRLIDTSESLSQVKVLDAWEEATHSFSYKDATIKAVVSRGNIVDFIVFFLVLSVLTVLILKAKAEFRQYRSLRAPIKTASNESLNKNNSPKSVKKEHGFKVKNIDLAKNIPFLIKPMRGLVERVAKLSVNIESQDMTIRCMPIALTYTLEKLIKQAVEAQEQSIISYGHRTIDLDCKRLGRYIRISVTDNALSAKDQSGLQSKSGQREIYNMKKLSKLDVLLQRHKGFLECSYDEVGSTCVFVMWPVDFKCASASTSKKIHNISDDIRFDDTGIVVQERILGSS